MTATPPTSLDQTISRYGIEVPEGQVAQLARYCQLLWEWNQKLNLTRHTDCDTFVTRDLIDSLALAKLLEPGEEVLDVGTGGGVPGVVVAILRPDVQMSLCESVAKKAKAVDAILRGLNLPLPVFHARAEGLLGDFRYHSLIARAVGSLAKTLKWFKPHWASIGRLLVIKGPRWVEERAEARYLGLLSNLELRRVHTYQMPGRDSENVVLQLRLKS